MSSELTTRPTPAAEPKPSRFRAQAEPDQTLPTTATPTPESRWSFLSTLAAALVIVVAVLWVGDVANSNLWSHSGYDTYTLQALAWRDGQIKLPHDYAWLELAIYKGDYYVSFPPLPAVVMWVLTFPFGADTPSGGVALAYFFGGLAACWKLLRRYLPADQAGLWIVFFALGGTVLSLASAGPDISGGVWYQAQLLAFFLTALAFLLVDGESKRGWAVGLACIALAVACRPFNLIYAPVLLWMLSRHLGGVQREHLVAAVRYLIAPAVIAIILGAYNYARFGNPLEFGHAYLPELTRSGEGMFLLDSVPNHFGNVLKGPTIADGKLTFPTLGGFAVYLTNPMLVIGLAVLLWQGLRRRFDVVDAILIVTIVIHAILLLSHRTNGGWQYGTRYLTDLLPVLVFVVARHRVRVSPPAAVAMGAVIAFNLIATLIFQTTKI